MSKPTLSTVAVVGTGVIGRSWAYVFTRAGCQTRLYDSDPTQLQKAAAWLADDLHQDCAAGLISDGEAAQRLACLSLHRDLKEALAGAAYLQESAPEQLDVKRAIYAELDRCAPPDCILGSSTSTLEMTQITAGLRGASRCIVAHPVNPPHVVPVVEVLPGDKTERAVVNATCEFLASVGQTPVLLNFYLPGFLLNRMQAALIKEAICLVESGAADVNAVDAVIRDGLGLRWVLMGPFGVANTNADGGVREYLTRYRQALVELMNNLDPTPTFAPDQIERLAQGTDQMVGGTPRADLRRWRDRMVRKIRLLKNEDPQP